jgi:hypothetical protein
MMNECVVFSLAEEAPDAYKRGVIGLEHVIRIQMLDIGYDPNDKEDIFEFWTNLGVSMKDAPDID